MDINQMAYGVGLALNEYDIYKFIEFLLFSCYLIFIVLIIQIWFLWNDLDKNKLKVNIASDSFFKRICIYVFLASIFFMIHEVAEGNSLPSAMVYFELFELLAYINLVLFTYEWYLVLKLSAKKSLPKELLHSPEKTKEHTRKT
jgi:hypothetical protein